MMKHYRYRCKQLTGKELDDDGKPVIYPASALEGHWDARNPTSVIAGLRRVLIELMTLPEKYTSPTKKKRWQTILDRLPEMPTHPPSLDELRRGKREKIRLLPAWPAEWDVDFKIHAPYKTTVEGKVRSGRMTFLREAMPCVGNSNSRLNPKRDGHTKDHQGE